MPEIQNESVNLSFWELFNSLGNIDSIEVSETTFSEKRETFTWEVKKEGGFYQITIKNYSKTTSKYDGTTGVTITGNFFQDKVLSVSSQAELEKFFSNKERKVEKIHYNDGTSVLVENTQKKVSETLEKSSKTPTFQTITGAGEIMTPEELKKSVRVWDYLEGTFSRGLVLEVTRKKVMFIVTTGDYYYVEKIIKPFDEVGKVKRIERPIGEKSINLKEAIVNYPEGKRFYFPNGEYVDTTKKAGDTLTYVVKFQNGKKLQLGIRRVCGVLIENKAYNYTSIPEDTFETK